MDLTFGTPTVRFRISIGNEQTTNLFSTCMYTKTVPLLLPSSFEKKYWFRVTIYQDMDIFHIWMARLFNLFLIT